jgi:hypothetical protein
MKVMPSSSVWLALQSTSFSGTSAAMHPKIICDWISASWYFVATVPMGKGENSHTMPSFLAHGTVSQDCATSEQIQTCVMER